MTDRPRLTVIGTGYLGMTHAACMASEGFEVLGLDIDAEKVARLNAGDVPIFEPGLAELISAGLSSGRLRFTTSYAEAAEFGDVHFVCVGTPQRRDGHGADLSQVEACIDGLAPGLTRPCLVVGKSTVPAGTAAALRERLTAKAPAGSAVELAWNPEFLREGTAVHDTLRPDRIVVGVDVRPRRGGAARRVRAADGSRDPAVRHRPRDGGTGQGVGECLPGHQDLLHQRDGRGVRRGAART